MAWNNWTNKYVKDEVVDALEERLTSEIYACDLLEAILRRMSIDERAAYLMDIADDYDIEYEVEDEDVD